MLRLKYDEKRERNYDQQLRATSIPNSVDWRAKGYVTEVGNQVKQPTCYNSQICVSGHLYRSATCLQSPRLRDPKLSFQIIVNRSVLSRHLLSNGVLVFVP